MRDWAFVLRLDMLYISSIQTEDKGAKVKKSATKGKKDASAAQNGETKNEVRGGGRRGGM